MQKYNTVGYVSDDIEIALTSSFDGEPYGQGLALFITRPADSGNTVEMRLTSFAELRALGKALVDMAENPRTLHLVEQPEGVVDKKSCLAMAKITGWQVPFDLPVVVTTVKGVKLHTDVGDMSECLRRDGSLRNLAAVARPVDPD